MNLDGFDEMHIRQGIFLHVDTEYGLPGKDEGETWRGTVGGVAMEMEQS